MVAIRNITKLRPTTADVLEAINTLHDCLDEHREETAKAHRGFAEDIGGVKERVARVEGQQTVILARVGGPPKPGEPAKPATIFSTWKTAGVVFGAVVSGAAAYRILWPLAVAVHHALLVAPGR